MIRMKNDSRNALQKASFIPSKNNYYFNNEDYFYNFDYGYLNYFDNLLPETSPIDRYTFEESRNCDTSFTKSQTNFITSLAHNFKTNVRENVH